MWKKNSKISSIVINTEKLYEAFIQLAYTKLACHQGQRKLYLIILLLYILNLTMIVGGEIPNEQPLLKIRYTEEDFIYPTATLPLNKNGDYSNIICK